ncbi:sulfotransferase family protein [Novosphingobium album (ex Liu et al. 2023)]|uniref:Sulfotransferase n=1 Tax=Novosphingobium album (ex Liu et al. 2023) TaxID=3031130 RepID=A0ABT5WLE3_9SPHN|nr:sulfotransferase [Novosphingobium album (ex Liu et al. 2023)]MDE8650127.1 sulfotransferase [Novosphingobium album (ex Liu et al. 2023)]
MESANDLIATARAESGLDDFGGDGFREGLEILVAALNREARLNALGEHALRDRILMHLKQRLQVEDWYRRHPEIAEGEIRQPLFGVSLPRTGSSALSFLLSSDPAVRYLRVWESSRPCPPPATVAGPDPRRGTAANALDAASGSGSHTPSGIDGAMECQDLMALDFKSQIFQAFAIVPSYSQWLIDADLTETYLYEKRVLRLLQWGEPARPWRLKAPSHVLWLDALDRVFPDARFVMTHRDPTDVLLSVATVYADIIERFTDTVDYHYIGELNVTQWSEGMKRVIAFREKGNDARFHDIHFRAMHKDPVGEVRGLYAWLGEDVSPVFAERMASWWRENDARERAEKPDPAKFGLDFATVRTDFAEYLSRMEKWAPFSEAA